MFDPFKLNWKRQECVKYSAVEEIRAATFEEVESGDLRTRTQSESGSKSGGKFEATA